MISTRGQRLEDVRDRGGDRGEVDPAHERRQGEVGEHPRRVRRPRRQVLARQAHAAAAELGERRDRAEVELAGEQQAERVGPAGGERGPHERRHAEQARQVAAVLRERGAAVERRPAEDASRGLERLLG